MGLSIWTQEGNIQDLSAWFLPPEEKQLSSKASDTPAFLNTKDYVKAPEKKEESPFEFSFLHLAILVGILFVLGVIKL